MLLMPFELILAVGIFFIAFVAILFEWAEKAVIALAGGLAMILFGVLEAHVAIEAIEFETLFLLMGMMMLVDVMRRSGMFSWLNVRIARFSRGQPWLIFLLFLFISALFSAFLDSVSTVVLMIPLIVSLTKGMGLDPKYFVIGVILFANIGGNLTLIGDPTNILIGTAAGLSFNDFIVNLYQPISLVTVFVLISLAILHWQDLRPVSGNLKKLFLSHLMIQKIELQYAKVHFKRRFIVKSIAVFLLTILGFVLQTHLGVPIYVLALSGAALLMLLTQGDSKVHQILQEVEWKTLLFFAGLFVMVGGLQEVGVLNVVANAFLLLSDNFLLLLLTVLWVSAIISMVLDNVPFVVIMIPVITQLQGVLEQGDPNMLWWALSLGAILGGCGTLVGSSANLVSANIASKHGVEISFLEYMRTALPLTIGMLILCSCYFYFLLG